MGENFYKYSDYIITTTRDYYYFEEIKVLYDSVDIDEWFQDLSVVKKSLPEFKFV